MSDLYDYDPKNFAHWLEYKPTSFLKNLINEMRQQTIEIDAFGEMLQSDLQAQSSSDLAEDLKLCNFILRRASNLNLLLHLAAQYVNKKENEERAK